MSSVSMNNVQEMIAQLHDVELKISSKELEIGEQKVLDAMSERAFRINMVASQPKEPSEAKLTAEFNVSEAHLRICSELNIKRCELSTLQAERNYLQHMIEFHMPTKG